MRTRGKHTQTDRLHSVMRNTANDDDFDNNEEPRKSRLRWLVGVLFCCSCSRRLEPSFAELRQRRRECSVRNCFTSPAFASLYADTAFLASLIWVLYEASIVMRERAYTLWWLIPTVFAAPTFLVVLLKLRYLRHVGGTRWQEDIIWNARIILLPMLSALINTCMISCWMLCAPLYVTELATTVATDVPLSIEDYAAVVRQATLNLLTEPSSILFYLTYFASVCCAIYLSARHRRVLLRFTVRAAEEGVNIGHTPLDTSLLTRAELAAQKAFDTQAAAVDTPVVRATPFTADTASIDSLYSTHEFVEEQASFITPGPIGTSYATLNNGATSTFRTVEETVPRPPGVKTFDTVRATLSKEAVREAQARHASADSGRTLMKPQQQQQPPPPTYQPPPPSSSPMSVSGTGSGQFANGGDDESETKIDSPRTIERHKRAKPARRTNKDE